MSLFPEIQKIRLLPPGYGGCKRRCFNGITESCELILTVSVTISGLKYHTISNNLDVNLFFTGLLLQSPPTSIGNKFLLVHVLGGIYRRRTGKSMHVFYAYI